MIADRISHFSLLTQSLPPNELFTLSFHSAVDGVHRDIPSVQFDLTGEKIFYNAKMKEFKALLHRFLGGKYHFLVHSSERKPDWRGLYLNFSQLLWNTVQAFTDEEVADLFRDSDDLVVARSPIGPSVRGFVSSDLLDSLVIFYHQYAPKPAERFLNDFSTTSLIQFHRSLLRLGLLGEIELRNTPRESPQLDTGSDAATPLLTPSPVTVNAKLSEADLRLPIPNESRRVVGLKKILHTVKTF